MVSRAKETKGKRAVKLIFKHFSTLKDPRVKRTRLHPLHNILVMALCGLICGADGWEDLEDFSKVKKDFFSSFLDMPYGTPSADTFRRVLSALNPERFAECFSDWVAALSKELSLSGQVVAMDGKTVRGALEKAGQRTTALHLVHAWASEQRLLLGQMAAEGAPGEVRTLPKLIGLLDVEGATVTTDANGCTAEVATACAKAGANYVLALKGNRGALHAHVEALFASTHAGSPPPPGATFHASTHEGHGRVETRLLWAMPLEKWPLKGQRWPQANTVVLVQRERASSTEADVPSVERHYYLASLPPDAEHLSRVVRAHWGVENGLHWCLDVGFGEDRRRIRDRAGAENFALLSRLALTLLKRETWRRGIAAKRKKAGWLDTYLLHVLSAGISKI